MDLYSRRIVGWAMGDHLRTELPLSALRMAISAQRPGAGLIHHSDRGVQGGVKRSSQHSEVGGCDERCNASIGAVRTSPLPSPGRPSVAGRNEQNKFWRAIAGGLSSEAAALEAGLSQPVGGRLFRKAGGMPPAMFRTSAKALSGRYLSLIEREEIALLKVQGHSIQEIGRRLGRAASTISRELRHNAATRGGGLEYRATTWKGRRHGPRKDRRWAKAWSPEQIARRLPIDFPDDKTMRISHEAIYQALFVQGRGALRRELTACLRTGRALRMPRPRVGRRQGLCLPGDHDQ
jgi:hypothetical protein